MKRLSLYFIWTLHGKSLNINCKTYCWLLFLIIVILSHSFKDSHNLEWNISRDYRTKSPFLYPYVFVSLFYLRKLVTYQIILQFSCHFILSWLLLTLWGEMLSCFFFLLDLLKRVNQNSMAKSSLEIICPMINLHGIFLKGH